MTGRQGRHGSEWSAPGSCVAMLLAGGQGSRLGVLTERLAKPAVPFGGKYRIIDFALSNCTNSGIESVGLLTQYQPLRLNAYIGIGRPWDLDRMGGGVQVLPPFITGKRGEWYQGTANAVFQNIAFIEENGAQRVLVLSGDHVYKMDYSKMIAYHREKQADATVAGITVPWTDASRFGIMNTDADERIVEFDEKPAKPKSNLASMGVYVFEWDVLRRFLVADASDPKSSHDFGKDVIPAMLEAGCRIYAYGFDGYWKDVGTIESLWEAHMDLLEDPPKFDLHHDTWRIYSRNPIEPPHYVGPSRKVTRSLISEGCTVYGEVDRSVLFPGVIIEEGAVVKESVVMPYSRISAGATVLRTIVAEGVSVGERSVVGALPDKSDEGLVITVVGEHARIRADQRVPAGTQVEPDYRMDRQAMRAAPGGEDR